MEKASEHNTKIIFSGVKSDLYYIIASNKSTTQVLKRTRKSIEGKQNINKVFENQLVALHKGISMQEAMDSKTKTILSVCVLEKQISYAS
ncbi:MAG: hypothetical protein OHK0057_00330 [Thermoflexibacter sp.]